MLIHSAPPIYAFFFSFFMLRTNMKNTHAAAADKAIGLGVRQGLSVWPIDSVNRQDHHLSARMNLCDKYYKLLLVMIRFVTYSAMKIGNTTHNITFIT